ncbi:MAG: 3-methyl-2-oxobutanoate hydroxymethyltransferase [Candidatus Margulisiibacteriota bacterium]
MLTAYDYAIARILDESGIDIVLVGDSLGNVMLGYRNTLPVTMTEMVVHTQAVSRAVKRALVVADMPFGSYQSDPRLAVSNAVDLIKAGAEAVKLESADYLETVKKIIKAGIPVMGHLGFTPQAVYKIGARVQGLGTREKSRLLKEARTLEKAGCFAVVLEMVEPDLAQKIKKALKIPVIGIGSGENLDGQVLVTYDMLGLYPKPPKFAKKYVDLAPQIKAAVKKFISG